MQKVFIWGLISLVLLGIGSCDKISKVADSRSFYLGVTPFPPDFTKQGEKLAYSFIEKNCDLVSHHFDDGIPWQEALDSTTIPYEIEEKVNRRISFSGNKVVYLAIAPLSTTRKDIAGYWNPDVSGEIRDKWKQKKMDDPEVIKAYFNFCCYMVEKFNPSYFNYAVESNNKDWNPEDFDKFVFFCSQVYSRLKSRYPSLPVFVSYMVTLDVDMVEKARKLNPYSDHISISSYPYMSYGSFANGSTDPQSIPSYWFSQYRAIDPSKPFSIAETGYIAKDMDLMEYGIRRKGNKQWQAEYLQMLLEVCNDYNAKFVVWFCAYDYDHANKTMQAVGLSVPMFKEWEYTGFYDGEGKARPALTTWKRWLKTRKR